MIIEAKPLHKKKKRLAKQNSKKEKELLQAKQASQSVSNWFRIRSVTTCLTFSLCNENNNSTMDQYLLQEKDPMQARLDSLDKRFNTYDREK